MKLYEVFKKWFCILKLCLIFAMVLFSSQHVLGQFSFSAEYDEVKEVNRNIFIVKKASNWGIVDKANSSKIPIEYKSIELNKDVWKYILQSKNGKFGFSDVVFDIIIPCEYDSISILNSPNINYIQCWKGDSSLIYNQQSKYLFAVNCQDLVSIDGHPKHYLVKGGNSKWGLNSDDEMKIPFMYDSLLYEYYVPENIKTKESEIILFKAKKGEFYGIIDNNNNVILNYEYQDVNVLSSNTFIIRKDNLYGVKTGDGKVIIPSKYLLIEHFIYHGGKGPYIKVVNNENMSGIYDKNGDVLIQIAYQSESYKLSNKTPGYSIEAMKDGNSYFFTSLNNFEPINFVDRESIGGNQMNGVYIYTLKNGRKCIVGGDPKKLCTNSFEYFDSFERITKENKEFLILKESKNGKYKYGIREAWWGKCLSSIIFDELNFDITEKQLNYFKPSRNESIIAVGYIAKNNSQWIISNFGLKEIK